MRQFLLVLILMSAFSCSSTKKVKRVTSVSNTEITKKEEVISSQESNLDQNKEEKQFEQEEVETIEETSKLVITPEGDNIILIDRVITNTKKSNGKEIKTNVQTNQSSTESKLILIDSSAHKLDSLDLFKEAKETEIPGQLTEGITSGLIKGFLGPGIQILIIGGMIFVVVLILRHNRKKEE